MISSEPRKHYFREQRGIPGRLIGQIIEILKLSSHPYATSELWSSHIDTSYTSIIHVINELRVQLRSNDSNNYSLSSSTHSQLIKTIKDCKFTYYYYYYYYYYFIQPLYRFILLFYTIYIKKGLLAVENAFAQGNTILKWNRPTFIRKPNSASKDISTVAPHEVMQHITIIAYYYHIILYHNTVNNHHISHRFK